MGRAKGKNRGDKQQKLDPLGKVIDEAKFGKQTFKQKPNLNQKSFKKSVEEGNILIDEKTTSKILKQANQQQDDLSRGIDYDELHIAELQGKIDAATLKKLQNTNASEDEDEDGDDQMQQFENLEDREDEKPDPNNPEQQVPDFELNEEDNKMFEMFMTGNKGEKGRTLQDEILAKLGQVKEAMGEDPDQQVDDLPAHGFMGGHITVSRGKATGGGIEALILGEGHENHPQTQLQESNLPPELVDMFIKVGLVMSKFRSTKFPKAFRQIPQLRHWEEALFHTRPDKWSAASVMQATKVFASSMSEGMAQRYYNLVLLPRVRDEIQYFKRLNFHIYEAIMKSVFKPIAFFRGFLLPLCNAGNCTLKEATIICSILREKSIPAKHAAAGMIKIAELDYNGANSLFLRTFIEKKYVLPYQVLDALVHHFLRMKTETRELPVLWHQCFLSFVRIYGKDITEDMKKALVKLTMKIHHKDISPEIKETLLKVLPRDIEIGGDDDYMAMI